MLHVLAAVVGAPLCRDVVRSRADALRTVTEAVRPLCDADPRAAVAAGASALAAAVALCC
jgi:hypothetical protein